MGGPNHPTGALPVRLITLKEGEFISKREVTDTSIGSVVR